MAMSVTELGLNKVVARRVIPKVTFMPSTEITGIDEHDVHVRGFLSGEKSVLEGVDNIILVTSKPPQEDLYHALITDMSDIRIIGDAREARWSEFATRSEEHTSELQSLMRTSSAVFCLKTNKKSNQSNITN